jgi:tetratricopeptide (TPR) repeat protein
MDDFQLAVEKLTDPEEQAVARFKLADVQFLQNDFLGAITNYTRLVDQYSALAPVKEALLPQALYQIVLASSEVGDHANATNALEKFRPGFRESELMNAARCWRATLLRVSKKPAEARAVLEKFIERFPNSPLLPEVKARSGANFYVGRQMAGSRARGRCLVAQFTNHVELPQADLRVARGFITKPGRRPMRSIFSAISSPTFRQPGSRARAELGWLIILHRKATT